jgi:hypothetical protein
MCGYDELRAPPRRSLSLIAASVPFALLTSFPARAADPQPGLWEIHKTIESRGASTARPTRTRCMTAEQVSQFAQLGSREFSVGQATCTSVYLSKTDGGVTWITQCPPLPLRIAASYTSDSPQHYVLTFRREIIVAGHVLASGGFTIEGKRIGECPK